MPGLSHRIEQLEKELLALGEETMLLDELDGLIAGVLVCPELIKPGDWLSVLSDREGGDRQPGFDNLDHANRVLGLVMLHYNEVARTLMEQPSRYTPLFAVDDANGRSDVLWEPSIEGFEQAVRLHPVAWQKLRDGDGKAAVALHGMLTLADIARGNQPLPQKDADAVTAVAPDLIGRWVVALNEARLANSHPMQGRAPRPSAAPTKKKIGRNDPCLCGSGKKYKKCCGLQ